MSAAGGGGGSGSGGSGAGAAAVSASVGLLKGKAGIVTGSTGGIGVACAAALAREGMNVVVHGRSSKEDAADAIAEVEAAAQHGARVHYVNCDLIEAETSARKLVDACVEEFGGLHVLVNNAGIQHVCSTDDFPAEKWDAVITVNLTACFHLIQLSLKEMKKVEGTPWGRIVNISSVHGLVASVGKPAYCAAKHGLNGLTKVVALENAADTNITCNAVCPGWVRTELVERQIEARAQEKQLSQEDAIADLVGEKQPTKRFSSASQIADMVMFLCSESASNMTGSITSMDGAWTTP